MTFLEEVRADLRKLPPRPWTAAGPWVDGADGEPVLIASAIQDKRSHAEAESLAQALARLPDHLAILTTATPELLLAQIETLTARIDELERELAALRLLEQNDLGL